MTNYKVGDTIITRKPHACGCDKWQIERVGADYKIRCLNCKRVVMLDAGKFHKAVKGVDD